MTDGVKQVLNRLQLIRRGRRAVLIGVGNSLRGDDGFGPALVQAVAENIPQALCIDAGTVPENYVPVVLRLRPDVILVADCTDWGGKPGEVALFSPGEVESLPFLTHGFPLSLVLEELLRRSQAEIKVLAVQGSRLTLGLPLSPPGGGSGRRTRCRFCCIGVMAVGSVGWSLGALKRCSRKTTRPRFTAAFERQSSRGIPAMPFPRRERAFPALGRDAAA